MVSLWNDAEAKAFESDLELRVYSSRLLGKSSELVLHGGGNTSVKSTVTNIFKEAEEILYVKGSGWDLATIEAPGFAPVKMDMLLKLAALETLSDTDMVKYQRSAMIDPGAPTPSIEAILHAILPFKYVDHTHADAVVALTNTPGSEAIIKELYGESIIIVPYVMPGFILSQEIARAIEGKDLSKVDGLILMHHGVFSFDDSAKKSYEKMIKLVTIAEEFNATRKQPLQPKESAAVTPLQMAQIRSKVSEVSGNSMLARLDCGELSRAFMGHPEVARIATTGPLTPDHVIRTKKNGAVISSPEDIESYAAEYRAYFNRHNDGTLTMLNPAPMWGVWRDVGTLSFGSSAKEVGIISDIKEHTMESILTAESIERYIALPENEIFKMEYWELEQAKLKKSSAKPPFQGRVALVTGAASGIGKACALAFADAGAAVIALDINPDIATMFKSSAILGITCDLTDAKQIDRAISKGVFAFGGIDVLVNNAGYFPENANIEDIDSDTWQKSMAINLTAQQVMTTKVIPFLKEGIDPAIIFIVSKNVPAPGKGASAYSVAKSGVAQLARIAALELAPKIRVNMLHPDAVFDTGLWTPELLQMRARHYGMSVQEYKTRNLLQAEITSRDVADLAVAMASELFGGVTGAQVAIDGGSDRII